MGPVAPSTSTPIWAGLTLYKSCAGNQISWVWWSRPVVLATLAGSEGHPCCSTHIFQGLSLTPVLKWRDILGSFLNRNWRETVTRRTRKEPRSCDWVSATPRIIKWTADSMFATAHPNAPCYVPKKPIFLINSLEKMKNYHEIIMKAAIGIEV